MTHVARLRGINVGGANALPMKKLRGLCDTLGWRDVESCVASGNLVFDAYGSPEAQAGALREAIRAARGLDSPVLVLTEATLRHARDDCPFTPEDPRQVHAGFLSRAPAPDRALGRGRGRAGPRATGSRRAGAWRGSTRPGASGARSWRSGSGRPSAARSPPATCAPWTGLSKGWTDGADRGMGGA